MKRAKYYQAIVACLSLLVVLLEACSTSIGPIQSTPSPSASPNLSYTCSTHTSNPVTLTMYYGSEKESWISDEVKDFNSRQITACDGPITVNAIPVGSGQSMQDIVNGKIQP